MWHKSWFKSIFDQATEKNNASLSGVKRTYLCCDGDGCLIFQSIKVYHRLACVTLMGLYDITFWKRSDLFIHT